MTELLLRAGANPNAADQKAFLPLHYACQEGHFNTVRCLLIYGSMVTVENEVWPPLELNTVYVRVCRSFEALLLLFSCKHHLPTKY